MTSKHLPLLGCALLAAVSSTPAFAAETAAGTTISNQASVTYSVGGTQTSTNSNTATFLVDKKVNLSVTEVGGSATRVSVGSTDQVTTFLVTNLTNATQDFHLVAGQQSISIPLLGVDDFDVTSMRVYVDANANGVYDAGVDTATYIDELAPDASKTVFIVANVPNNNNEHVAIVGLNAIVAAGGSVSSLGADLTATSLLQADSANAVDIVFADDANLLDQLRDGQHWAFDAYLVDSAAVSLTKTAKVISDPYNLLINPKAIPGATVEYCINVSNSGPGTATSVSIADTIPTNTTYVSGSLTIGSPGIAGACILIGATEDDNATGADESDPYGGSFDGSAIAAVLGSVAPSSPVALSFRVTIN